MADKRLETIKKHCDTSGTRLHEEEKDLLCRIIDNQDKYDGYQSRVYIDSDEGKDYKGRWSSSTKTQYTIHVNDDELSIDEHYEHSCDDGFERTKDYTFTGARDILDALSKIISEL